MTCLDYNRVLSRLNRDLSRLQACVVSFSFCIDYGLRRALRHSLALTHAVAQGSHDGDADTRSDIERVPFFYRGGFPKITQLATGQLNQQ
ncbi:MAG: hypothetical protein ABIG63_11635 [Chloroflexota bacterium]